MAMKEDMTILEIEAAAKNGDIDACRELGVLYYEGINGTIDLEKSAYYFAKAAKAGDVHSMYCMGLNYIGGTGVPKDTEKGLSWLQQASEKGDSYAMFELASHYYCGDVVVQDYEKSLAYFEMAAQHGNIFAMINAAKQYEHGLGGETDTERARVFYREAYKKLEEWAIEENDDMAQEWLGELYYKGCPLIEIKKDYPQAIVWFEKAAKAGNTSALINLGMCYRFGIGTLVDMRRAIELNEKAAAKNETIAMCNLASIYSMGEGVEKDDKKAVELWAKAANLGDPVGQSCLGEMYMLGKGVERNYTQEAYWSRKAHEGGADGATDNLAILYQKGLGVEKDEKKAFSLYSEAAAKDNLHSRVAMAECYIEGWGTVQDLNKAYKILEGICGEEEDMREQSVTYVFEEDGVRNPFNRQDVEFYAKAYYLLGTLTYAGKGSGGSNLSKALTLLRMADRLGYTNEEKPEETAEKFLNKIIQESEKEVISDTVDCYVEVREDSHKGERYQIVLHHADGEESVVKFQGRNKFLYLLALLVGHEGKSVNGLTTKHFSYMRDDLSDMASDVRVDTKSYEEWIDEFIYAEDEAAQSMRRAEQFQTLGYCSYNPYRYSNAFSGANRAIKACCLSNEEFETFKLRSTGGRSAVTTISLDSSQIELPNSLLVYLDCLPTQKEIANYRPKASVWLPVKE